MIEVAFRNILAADTNTAAIVADRVWFNIRPQDQRQAGIVLTLVSSIPGMTFQGRGGYVNGRMQINCVAPTYPQAKALATAARAALDGYSGTIDGTTIAYIESETIKDIPVTPLQGAAVPATFGVSIDALFMVYE